MSNMAQHVKVDIPCDVQQIDQTGHPWAFLDEARDPSQIVQGAIVVSGDDEDPVVARVVSLTSRPGGVVVHLEILPGEPAEYVEALTRARLLSA